MTIWFIAIITSPISEILKSEIHVYYAVATIEDLRNDILKATEEQQKLMALRKPFLGSKNNEDQMNAFRLTTRIMKYEDFIRDTEKQLRNMN